MTTDDAISGIIHYRSKIHEEAMWRDQDALSEVVSKLSVFNSYLSDSLAQYHKAVTDKAYAVFTEALAAGEGVTKADTMSRGESTEERERYENVKNIQKATEGLISVLQTRIRVME